MDYELPVIIGTEAIKVRVYDHTCTHTQKREGRVDYSVHNNNWMQDMHMMINGGIQFAPPSQFGSIMSVTINKN